MKRITLFVEESVDHELHVLARRKGVPVSALVRESLARYITEQKRSQSFALRFLGQGHSGRKDVAERHEELLFHDHHPHCLSCQQSAFSLQLRPAGLIDP